jgi:hypothetical protein
MAKACEPFPFAVFSLRRGQKSDTTALAPCVAADLKSADCKSAATLRYLRQNYTLWRAPMAKSPAVPTKPAPKPTRSAAQEHAGPSLPSLKVTYYRRMKRQRVYAVTAAWYNPDKRRPPPGTGPVVVRLLMAGAQVIPSEQPLDPAKPDAKAVFYVTPLARGWLRNECMEVLVGGRKVQEMPLRSKVTTQRMTWVLLLLTFLVPWFFYSYVLNSPLKNAYVGKTVGQALAIDIAKVVPDTPGFIKNNVPIVHEGLVNFRDDIVASAYDLLWKLSQDHPMHLYTGIGLLLLTILSWLLHRDKRKRRYGKPVPLAAGGPGKSADDDDDFE